MIPGTIVYVFIGTTVSSLTNPDKGDDKNGTLKIIVLVVGSVLACAAIIYISIVAKKILKRITDEAEKKLIDEGGAPDQENIS